MNVCAGSSLSDFSSYLRSKLQGQDYALDAFSRAVMRAVRNRREERSRAMVLVLGPTGTGKTEMVLRASEYLFGERGRGVRRLDMASFMTLESVDVMLGGPGDPGLMGRALDELAEEGGGFLLLDEIEKAHPKISNVFLSFDSGIASMNDGRKRSTEDVIVVMTSNLGAKEAARMKHSNAVAREKRMKQEAEAHFSPEVLIRFSDVIATDVLAFDIQVGIADSMLASEIARQEARLGRWIEVTDRLVNLVVQQGFTKHLGARALRNAVERLVCDAIEKAVDGGREFSTMGEGMILLDVQGSEAVAVCAETVEAGELEDEQRKAS